jgi:hypothetical protein
MEILLYWIESFMDDDWGRRPNTNEVEGLLFELSVNNVRRSTAQRDLRVFRYDLQRLLKLGSLAGIPVSTMARAAKISRNTAHEYIRWNQKSV